MPRGGCYFLRDFCTQVEPLEKNRKRGKKREKCTKKRKKTKEEAAADVIYFVDVFIAGFLVPYTKV